MSYYNLPTGFENLDLNALVSVINTAVTSVQAKITSMQQNASAVSIGDMFEMQIMMNNLSQLSEMGTSVVAASSSAIKDMARNVQSS